MIAQMSLFQAAFLNNVCGVAQAICFHIGESKACIFYFYLINSAPCMHCLNFYSGQRCPGNRKVPIKGPLVQQQVPLPNFE